MTGRGYEPDFDIDRAYGEAGELTVRHALGLGVDRVEVKRKRYPDGEFYVELSHDPGRGDQYRPSGLATTKADYFVYVIADTGILVWIPTRLLRERLRDALG